MLLDGYTRITLHTAQRHTMHLAAPDTTEGRSADPTESKPPLLSGSMYHQLLFTGNPLEMTTGCQFCVRGGCPTEGLTAPRTMTGATILQTTVQLPGDRGTEAASGDQPARTLLCPFSLLLFLLFF